MVTIGALTKPDWTLKKDPVHGLLNLNKRWNGVDGEEINDRTELVKRKDC